MGSRNELNAHEGVGKPYKKIKSGGRLVQKKIESGGRAHCKKTKSDGRVGGQNCADSGRGRFFSERPLSGSRFLYLYWSSQNLIFHLVQSLYSLNFSATCGSVQPKSLNWLVARSIIRKAIPFNVSELPASACQLPRTLFSKIKFMFSMFLQLDVNNYSNTASLHFFYTLLSTAKS